MDIATTTAPKSDQLNAEDLLAGPQTFTIEKVTAGSSEQPVNIHLAELPGRPYRPSKSMRRVLLNAWGRETEPYAGRRLTLYRDASVKFGPDAVGGIKISHLSGIDRAIGVALTVTRGKRATHTVDPLPGLSKVDELKAEWRGATPERRAEIEAEVATLQGGAQ